MMALAWPVVALAGMTLAFVVAMYAVGRRQSELATKAEFIELAKAGERLEDRLGKVEARIPAQPGDRAMPFGLRRGQP